MRRVSFVAVVALLGLAVLFSAACSDVRGAVSNAVPTTPSDTTPTAVSLVSVDPLGGGESVPTLPYGSAVKVHLAPYFNAADVQANPYMYAMACLGVDNVSCVAGTARGVGPGGTPAVDLVLTNRSVSKINYVNIYVIKDLRVLNTLPPAADSTHEPLSVYNERNVLMGNVNSMKDEILFQ